MKTRFHEYLAMLRKQSGYTQAQMAERLEISRSTYTNYETGNRSPDLETLERISDILDCTMDELFGRTGTLHRTAPDIIYDSKVPYQVNADKKQKRRKPKLAIGVQDFRFLRERDAYYVDKTEMIEEFLESWYQVTLVTRPRRFGKTLNMSMLAEFLDCTKDSADIFAGTWISESDLMEEMNRHPVVFLSFLNVKADNPEGMLYQLCAALRGEYERYASIIRDGTLTNLQISNFDRNYECLCRSVDEKEQKKCISCAVVELCQTLEAYYGEKVYLLLDEYDTPFISANSGGYYTEIRDVLSGMLSSSLKGNPSLEKAMLTGIQRVAKENIFSGLNNLIVCTVKDPEYADCFGFTEEEVQGLLEYCGMEFTDDVRRMYDGYRFGTEMVYNPWSVTCYAARKELESYWVNTSENRILKNALAQRGNIFARKYQELLENGTVTTAVELSTAYYEEPTDESLWGLLLNAGMVTVQEKLGENYYRLRVPNQEVWKAFQELTAFYLQVEEGHLNMMLQKLKEESMEAFAEEYQWILLELPSYYDLKNENSYHMMMLGMCAFLQWDYIVKSNRENGSGRGDILLYAKKQELPSIVLEFKYTKDEAQDLEELAQEAVEQIADKKYDSGMNGTIYHIGIAHYGKKAAVKWKKNDSGCEQQQNL